MFYISNLLTVSIEVVSQITDRGVEKYEENSTRSTMDGTTADGVICFYTIQRSVSERV